MNKEEQKDHEHNYRIFRDNKAIDVLTFYCTKCLKLRKLEKRYD